jgi:hypothetical protein
MPPFIRDCDYIRMEFGEFSAYLKSLEPSDKPPLQERFFEPITGQNEADLERLLRSTKPKRPPPPSQE